MRFRMCCWPLAANRAFGGTPRELRVCKLCNEGRTEDEYHVLVECGAYARLREEAGIVTGGDMRSIMMSSDQAKLAGLLSSIWALRHSRVPFGR